MFKKLIRPLVLFLVCLLFCFSNATLTTSTLAFLSNISTTKKIEPTELKSETLKQTSKYSEEDLLKALEKVYVDNEEVHENENTDSNSSNSFLSSFLNDNSVALLTKKKNSFLTTSFDKGISKNNRLFILFHSWKFHLI